MGTGKETKGIRYICRGSLGTKLWGLSTTSPLPGKESASESVSTSTKMQCALSP